jgi:hypothetical protein
MILKGLAARKFQVIDRVYRKILSIPLVAPFVIILEQVLVAVLLHRFWGSYPCGIDP